MQRQIRESRPNIVTLNLPRAGVLLAAVLVLSGHAVFAQPIDLGDGVLIVSDFGFPTKIRIVDPGADTIVYDYLLSRDPWEPCGDHTAFCFPTGMHYTRTGDTDYLNIGFTVINPAARGLADKMYSVIQRVTPTTSPTLAWKIKNLDFSDVPDAEHYCRQDPADPCGQPVDPACRLSYVEGFQIIDDRPEDHTVRLIAADAFHGRVLQLTMDYAGGNTCAHVDWVIGAADSKHPAVEGMNGGWPNDVNYVDDGPAGKYLLIDYYQDEITPATPTGGSRIEMWHAQDGTDWTLAWEFPDPSLGPQAFLNTPHAAELLRDPLTGERWIWYSHSRGAADDWMAEPDGYGATFGLLKVGQTLSDPPQYVFDAGLFDDRGDATLMFTRDQDYLPDGSLLLLDAGCQNFCSYTPTIYHVAPFFSRPQPSTLEGYYTPDHAEQRFVDIDSSVIGAYRCGFEGLFEVEWVPKSELGPALTSAVQQARRPCPIE